MPRFSAQSMLAARVRAAEQQRARPDGSQACGADGLKEAPARRVSLAFMAR
jgi:hypothetical protein